MGLAVRFSGSSGTDDAARPERVRRSASDSVHWKATQTELEARKNLGGLDVRDGCGFHVSVLRLEFALDIAEIKR